MGKARDDLRNHHRVVAVGPADDIVQFVHDLERTGTRNRVDVVAYVADDLDPGAAVPAELRRLCRLPDRNAIHALTDHDVTVDLLVRAGRPGPDEMWALSQRAHDLGVTVALAPHRHDATSTVAMTYVPLGSTPLLMVENPTLRPTAVWTKAIFDRVMAALLLVALSPVLAVIAAAIALRDGRPVLFRQTRVGHYGQHFGCWKFRTMVPDAEEQLIDLQAANEADGPLFKLKEDPRVTRTGGFLRRHSLDELPQLINVLKGDMSIVGPRPPLPVRGRGLRQPLPPPPQRQARLHRPVADPGPLRPALGRRHLPRPHVHRSLEPAARPGDHGPHRPDGPASDGAY